MEKQSDEPRIRSHLLLYVSILITGRPAALGESRLFVMLAASLLDDPSSSIEDVYESKLDWNGPPGSRKVTGYCDGKKEVRGLY